MKLIKSKLLQKHDGRRSAKYLVTLEVTDYDIEMFEDLDSVKICDCGNFQDKYNIWLRRVYHEFWKLWRKYDK